MFLLFALDILLITIFGLIIMFLSGTLFYEYTTVFIIISLFMSIFLGIVRNYMADMARSFIINRARLEYVYYTLRQVEFDLKQNKRVYIEMNDGDDVFRGTVRIDENELLEICMMSNNKKRIIQVINENIDMSLESFFTLVKENSIIVIKEEYIRLLEKVGMI